MKNTTEPASLRQIPKIEFDITKRMILLYVLYDD